MKKIIFIVVLVAIVGFFGYKFIGSKSDFCRSLSDSNFISIKDYPVGLPMDANNIPTGNLLLEFMTDGTYRRLVSDYFESGRYKCNGNTLVFLSDFFPAVANYDKDTEILKAYGIEYKKE